MPGGGYTIIEVMIFLVVSTALLSSVMALVNGKQERTRFTQTANAFEQDIRDILNDVSTGYYPSAGNSDFECQSTISGSGYSVNFSRVGTASVEQGANVGCVFLGKAIRLGAPNRTDYQTYTMVAARNAAGLEEADTKLLGLLGNPGLVDNDVIPADVEIVDVISKTDSTRNVSGIALVSEFSQVSQLNNAVTGNAAKVTLYEVLDNFDSNAGRAPAPGISGMEVAEQGLIICLQQSGSGGRKAALVLGAGGQQLTTEVKIDSEVPMECP